MEDKSSSLQWLWQQRLSFVFTRLSMCIATLRCITVCFAVQVCFCVSFNNMYLFCLIKRKLSFSRRSSAENIQADYSIAFKRKKRIADTQHLIRLMASEVHWQHWAINCVEQNYIGHLAVFLRQCTSLDAVIGKLRHYSTDTAIQTSCQRLSASAPAPQSSAH